MAKVIGQNRVIGENRVIGQNRVKCQNTLASQTITRDQDHRSKQGQGSKHASITYHNTRPGLKVKTGSSSKQGQVSKHATPSRGWTVVSRTGVIKCKLVLIPPLYLYLYIFSIPAINLRELSAYTVNVTRPVSVIILACLTIDLSQTLNS